MRRLQQRVCRPEREQPLPPVAAEQEELALGGTRGEAREVLLQRALHLPIAKRSLRTGYLESLRTWKASGYLESGLRRRAAPLTRPSGQPAPFPTSCRTCCEGPSHGHGLL